MCAALDKSRACSQQQVLGTQSYKVCKRFQFEATEHAISIYICVHVFSPLLPGLCCLSTHWQDAVFAKFLNLSQKTLNTQPDAGLMKSEPDIDTVILVMPYA